MYALLYMLRIIGHALNIIAIINVNLDTNIEELQPSEYIG